MGKSETISSRFLAPTPPPSDAAYRTGDEIALFANGNSETNSDFRTTVSRRHPRDASETSRIRAPCTWSDRSERWRRRQNEYYVLRVRRARFARNVRIRWFARNGSLRDGTVRKRIRQGAFVLRGARCRSRFRPHASRGETVLSSRRISIYIFFRFFNRKSKTFHESRLSWLFDSSFSNDAFVWSKISVSRSISRAIKIFLGQNSVGKNEKIIRLRRFYDLILLINNPDALNQTLNANNHVPFKHTENCGFPISARNRKKRVSVEPVFRVVL